MRWTAGPDGHGPGTRPGKAPGCRGHGAHSRRDRRGPAEEPGPAALGPPLRSLRGPQCPSGRRSRAVGRGTAGTVRSPTPRALRAAGARLQAPRTRPAPGGTQSRRPPARPPAATAAPLSLNLPGGSRPPLDLCGLPPAGEKPYLRGPRGPAPGAPSAASTPSAPPSSPRSQPGSLPFGPFLFHWAHLSRPNLTPSLSIDLLPKCYSHPLSLCLSLSPAPV